LVKRRKSNNTYENPTAAGVEEYFSVPQSMLPPPAQEDSDKKQPRPRPNQDVCANDAKADESDGGSRLVSTNSMPTSDGGE